ncbi:MAG TPA: alpha/beta fold hydrolase [Anaerolineae bacterium]|nr:alpha/beta fold hydrolase [Anaerolineae bacterium]
MSRKDQALAKRASYRIHFKNPDMDFYLMCLLINETHEGATFGEVMHAASRIKENDPVSWADEWIALGERSEGRAEKALSKGHEVSARQAYLRAYTYYRFGTIGLHPRDPRRTEIYHKFVLCFQKGAALLDTPIEPVQVPWKVRGDDVFLPGYFMRPDDSGTKRPTLIIVNGGETYPEDQYFWGGAGALQRGYNVLTITYDGQRAAPVLYPDWGPLSMDVMDPPGFHAHVVDYALSRPETDPDRLAAIGFSSGGYYAAHQASLDQRIKAIILAAPLYDLRAFLEEEIPAPLRKAPPFIFNALTSLAGRLNPFTQVALEDAIHGARVENISDFMDIIEQIPPVEIDNITCPSLALVGEGDSPQEIDQCHRFFDRVSSSIKAKRVFRREDGASSHCQVDNMPLLEQVAYDWLDEVFAKT